MQNHEKTEAKIDTEGRKDGSLRLGTISGGLHRMITNQEIWIIELIPTKRPTYQDRSTVIPSRTLTLKKLRISSDPLVLVEKARPMWITGTLVLAEVEVNIPGRLQEVVPLEVVHQEAVHQEAVLLEVVLPEAVLPEVDHQEAVPHGVLQEEVLEVEGLPLDIKQNMISQRQETSNMTGRQKRGCSMRSYRWTCPAKTRIIA